MNKVYHLLIFDKELSDDNHKEGFDIGCFSSCEKARETAEY